MTIVPRTCTELRDEKGAVGSPPISSKPLAAFRDYPAYVLLGDPGMGKSTAFHEEVAALGAQGQFVTARDLATLHAGSHPEWKGKTLFIDGLDEIRAGQADPRMPLDRIRSTLEKLGNPCFRLSCRPADWLTNDQQNLAAISPSGEVTVLSLDPLNRQQVAELLKADSNVPDVPNFVKEAEARGMEGLLHNPQSLYLLARAVHDGEWPGGRKETFEKACLTLAGEHNEEHLSITPRQDPKRILDTAGRLCAVLLVSGASGCATITSKADDANKADANYPLMTDCGPSDDDCRQAVSSRLFRHAQEGRAEPVHRQIAEYLAARHIAKLIEDGLPALRVLALISGPDETVVSELRGLSAWLAAHSPLARPHLIERDPVGVALYGDISALAAEERQALFDSAVREPRKLAPTYRTATAFASPAAPAMAQTRAPGAERTISAAFASLATPAMASVLEHSIRKPPSGPDGELVADFVLRLLREAPPLTSRSDTIFEAARDDRPSAYSRASGSTLSDTIFKVVRDDRRWPRARHAALTAFLHYNQHTDGRSNLLPLLHDIAERRVADPNDELLGQLLTVLYPQQVPPGSVWDYIKESDEDYFGAYWCFWVLHLPSLSSHKDLGQLLDLCCDRLPELEQAGSSMLESCIARLLVRGLETDGDELEVTRLYSWLDAGVRLRVGQYASRDDAASIRDWIEARPDRHLDLLLEGMWRLPDDHWHAGYEAFQRLFGASVSAEFFWECATRAKSMYDRHRSRAESLLRFAVQYGSLDPERLRRLLADNPGLSAFLQPLLAPLPPSPDLDQIKEQEQRRHQDRLRKAQDELKHLQDNESALRNNKAPPALLNGLARTYFGDCMGFTPDLGIRRLKELVAGRKPLLDAAKIGLRLTLERRDMPDAGQILEQRLSSKLHYLCWPYLAGLAEAERTGTLTSDWWTDARMRRAIAIYYGYGHGDYQPSWYQHLIAEHPATVASVQVQFAGALFSQGIDNTGNTNIWHLAFDRAHAKVARQACLALLRAFPARARSNLLGALEYLLLAAAQHADRTEFERLIDLKLSRKSMPACHRGRWLATGCCIAMTKFAPSAKRFLCAGRQQARTLHFASFFCPQGHGSRPVESDGTDLAALLIRFVGRFVAPDKVSEGLVTPVMEASTLVGHCIRVVAGDPSPQAADTLDDLLHDPQLSSWRPALARAADDQSVIRRDHQYRHPTAEEVAKAFQGGAPAGVADLTALVLDRLDELELRMRSGSTDDWKAFWNEHGHSKPKNPKPEESCTQALVRELRHLCRRKNVKIEREERYPNNVRPDISVSYGDYRVPIEVKRNDSRDLWHAAITQLVDKYSSDPATNGNGIYVVLWFGRDCTPRSPTGTRPATPKDLQQQLEATMGDRERRTVHVRVIDVAPRPVRPK